MGVLPECRKRAHREGVTPDARASARSSKAATGWRSEAVRGYPDVACHRAPGPRQESRCSGWDQLIGYQNTGCKPLERC